jgi:hypothetical protein
VLFLLAGGLTGAQTSDQPLSLAAWQARSFARFLPKNIIRTYPDIEATRVIDLDPLVRELTPDLPGPLRWYKFGGRARSLNESVSVLVREEDDLQYRRQISIRLSVAPGFREAERRFAEYLGSVSMYIPDKQLGKTRFGEASQDLVTSLIFIRRNVLVIIDYSASIFEKSTRRRKAWIDPEHRLKADALARRIDDLILLNPR